MHQQIITYPSDIPDNSGIVISHHFQPAGRMFPVHWHNFFEFEIILSGSVRHHHNSVDSLLSPGSAYFMGYNDFHGLEILENTTIYNIHFEKHLLSPELADFLEFNQFQCHFSPEETAQIQARIESIEAELSSQRPFRNLISRGLLEEILIQMIRKSTVTANRIPTSAIRRAIVYLDTHFRETLSLEMLASQLSLSPNYLGQLFKSETGTTFHQFLNQLRLKYACTLLTTTDLTVKEIAFESGYSSVEHFMYVFKRNLLITPSSYRSNQIR